MYEKKITFRPYLMPHNSFPTWLGRGAGTHFLSLASHNVFTNTCFVCDFKTTPDWFPGNIGTLLHFDEGSIMQRTMDQNKCEGRAVGLGGGGHGNKQCTQA